MNPPIRVVFVCLGNICRSPLAEGAFRHLAAARGLSDRFDVDSAGTAAYHSGEPPDPRSVAVARSAGVDISDQRARQVSPSDLAEADYVFAMDSDNLDRLESMKREGDRAQIQRLLDYGSPTGVVDVPDPYYGGPNGFRHVYELVYDACNAFLDHVQQNHLR